MAKKELRQGTAKDLEKLQKQYRESRKIAGKENYKKYAPIFNNLSKNKIIYHERITSIVRLENLEVTEEYFQATAIREKVILSDIKRKLFEKFNTLQNLEKPESWVFKGTWDSCNITENPLCIAQPYANFVIWIEPDFVMYIEKLLDYGDFDDIMELLNKTPKPNLSIENRFRKSNNL